MNRFEVRLKGNNTTVMVNAIYFSFEHRMVIVDCRVYIFRTGIVIRVGARPVQARVNDPPHPETRKSRNEIEAVTS